MSRGAKLGGRSPEETLIMKPETKKAPRPRNPLKDLNSTSLPPLGSAEAPRGRCPGFIPSNSSSKPSIPRSRSLPRTPKSAPSNPRTLSSRSANPPKLRTSRAAHKNPSTPSSGNPEQLGSQKLPKPKTPDLFHGWNRRKPSSEERVGEAKDASARKNPEPDIGFEMKEGERPKTPNSTTTPPIQASISPEIPTGSSVAHTPVCFGAGHLTAGVHYRRKCKPRGILTIDGGASEVMGNPGPWFRDAGSNGSRVSSPPPPLTEASMHWISSPSKGADADTSASSSSRVRTAPRLDEASLHWFLFPRDDADVVFVGSASRKPSAFGNEISSGHELCGLSPSNGSTSGSSKPGELMGVDSPVPETTPLFGIGITRTPTTGSSTSPFSMILQNAAALSGLKDCRDHQKRGRYRYGPSVNTSPISGDTWGDGNVISTPSFSSSSQQVKLSLLELDSSAEVLRRMRLSPESEPTNKASDLLPLSSESFQFGWPATPSNSIDLGRFKKPSCTDAFTAEELCLKEQSSPDPKVRISWQEGVISRIYEIGELDSCKWLSDNKENAGYCEEDKAELKFDFKFDPNSWRSIAKEGNDRLANGFGSIEFGCDEGKLPPEPISCAESISTDGREGLISSGDSDWALFYKNHLFRG